MDGVIAYAQSYVHIHLWKRKGVCIGVMLASPFEMNNYNYKIWFFMYVSGYWIPYAWKRYAYYVRIHNVT
jgi:hypothetical protein